MFGSTSSTASGPPFPWASPDFAEKAAQWPFPGAQSPQGEGSFNKKRPLLPLGNRGRRSPWYHLNSRDAPQADPSPWTLYRAHPSPPTPVQGSGSGMYFSRVCRILSPAGCSLQASRCLLFPSQPSCDWHYYTSRFIFCKIFLCGSIP